MDRRLVRRDPDSFGDLLRREAAGDRPRFSLALHERILQRLPVGPAAGPVARVVEPRPLATRGWVWGLFGSVVGVAALAALTIAFGGARPNPAGGTLPAAAVVTIDLAGTTVAGDGVSPDVAGLAIDSVPSFDQLEAGVREGVSTLAATLLDVPEWRMLADFDAAGFLGADVAP